MCDFINFLRITIKAVVSLLLVLYSE